MFVLNLVISISKGLVAGETEQFALLDQIVFAGCGMWIVAFHALTICNYLVNAFGIFRDHRRVTDTADHLWIPGQKLAMAGGVGIMAAGAFILFQGGVHKLPGHFLLEGIMAFHAEVSPGACLQFKVLIGGCKQ